MALRVLLAGGGTGGHLFPALAIEAEFKRQGALTLLVGTRTGIEAKIAAPPGLDIRFINAAGFKRGKIIANLTLPFKVFQSFIQSWIIVRRFQPQAALGTGGYVCGPVLLATALHRVPFFLQEQNSYPGVTTRWLAHWAKMVFLNFEEAARYLPKGCHSVRVGNPVRTDFRQLDRETAVKAWGLKPELPTLLVFGGSQGALSLNRAVQEVLPQWGRICNLIWARGWREASPLEGWTGPGKLVFRPFIEDMPSTYAAADLAVCRSGALSLSELQAATLPAILIPYPHAAADHQSHNALAYARKGGALVLPETELNGNRLYLEVKALFEDSRRLEVMRQALKVLPEGNAAAIIVQSISAALGIR